MFARKDGNLSAWAIWGQFLLVAGVIAYSGTQLSRYGDILAEKTGMGRTWLGLVVLATVTSLPEMATGISAVLWVHAPDITVGDLLGSCVFNLLILAGVDLLHPPGPVLTAADRGHLLGVAFGIIMLGVTVMGLLPPPFPVSRITLGHIGLSSLVLWFCYLVAMRSIFRYQRRERAAFLAEQEEMPVYDNASFSGALWKFGLNALVVAAAGAWMPRVAADLAGLMGWHLSLVGTIFVAIATSLPELAVTMGALRLGAVDLAVGNLFGSNLINLAVLGLMDALYLPGPLLQAVAPEHAATGVMAIIMTGIAGAELVYRPQKKPLRWISAGAFFMAFLYAAYIFLQFLTKG
ncbi:MAG: sodium:calcium antiporter [Thermodesulfobacteriota bacterium]